MEQGDTCPFSNSRNKKHGCHSGIMEGRVKGKGGAGKLQSKHKWRPEVV